MNVEIGAEAAQFPEKEYINGIAIAVYMWISLQTHPYFLWWHWLYNKKAKTHRSSIGLEIRPLQPLGPSCPLQTILLGDLVGCGNPLQIVMAVWRTFFNLSALNSHYSLQRATTPDPASSPNCHYHLQRAVIPDWMGSTALRRHITAFFSRAEKHSEDITRHFFLMNMKG
jgi:hypothetical protein